MMFFKTIIGGIGGVEGVGGKGRDWEVRNVEGGVFYLYF